MMSDDSDVERLLQSFQTALESLKTIENVESIINKLDSNKNRKSLKKVKHIVNELYTKVGITREKVIKAYKRVKTNSLDNLCLKINPVKEVNSEHNSLVTKRALQLRSEIVSSCESILGHGLDISCENKEDSNEEINDNNKTNKDILDTQTSTNKGNQVNNNELENDNVSDNLSEVNRDKEVIDSDVIESTPVKIIAKKINKNTTNISYQQSRETLNMGLEDAEKSKNDNETKECDVDTSKEKSILVDKEDKRKDNPIEEDKVDENETAQNSISEDINTDKGKNDQDNLDNLEARVSSDESKGNAQLNGELDKSSDKENNVNTDKETSEKADKAEPDGPVKMPLIKLVDINKLMEPSKKPLEVYSPKPKKCVTFDSSVIILSSSDEDTPKKDPEDKKRNPLKSAMRRASATIEILSDSDSKENRKGMDGRKRSKRLTVKKEKIKAKKLVSDDSGDSSDASDYGDRRRLTRRSERNLKMSFSKLVDERSRRKATNNIRYQEKDDENSSDEYKSSSRMTRSKKNKLQDEEDRDNRRDKRRRNVKDIMEESSLSEGSDDSDILDKNSKGSTRKSKVTGVKRTKLDFTDADKNDPKFKYEVYISLPLFKCEQLQEIYEKKRELFEIKKLTKVNDKHKDEKAKSTLEYNLGESDKPQNKRIKLTLKLKKVDDGKSVDLSDQDENANLSDHDECTNLDDDGAAQSSDKDSVCEDTRMLVEACLDQIQDSSDKEEERKDSNEEEEGGSGAKKDSEEIENDKETTNQVENDDKDSNKEENHEEKDKSSKCNGKVTDNDDSEEENRENKNTESEDCSKDEKKSKWKKDQLLNDKIDTSDSDAEIIKRKKASEAELVSDEEIVSKQRKSKKRTKKSVILDSDSDNSKESDKNDNESADDKSSSSESEGEEDEKKEKPVRRRIKRAKDSSSDEDDKSTRKHIRRMIDRDSLSETTKKAEEDEKERKARIVEKQKKYNQIFELKSDTVADRVVLDFDEKKEKPLLSVHKKLVKELKPHQVHGVKFMWDACFESLSRTKKTSGSGCILAHCMGLGKTLQVIALAHTLLTNSDKTNVTKIMVVCPVNTVLNWKNEFAKWMPKHDDLEVFELVSCKTSSVNHERSYIVNEWHKDGGVLIIGYNMFRTLTNPDNKSLSKKLRTSFQEGLMDPGPDLVVCDEGHLLKNEKTSLNIAMNRIKTARRIVLTGTPLQNNLREYWCMVQFIKPNLLGTYKEYMNRFVNPITNGQYTDSTPHDIIIMRKRSHVLHKLLDGVVQRQDYAVLEPYLPPKHEYVLFVKLTELQVKLYKHYIQHLAKKNDGSSRTSFLFTDFQNLQRICTHPKVLQEKSIEDKDKQLEDSDSEGSLKDFIDDGSEGKTTSDSESSESSSNSDASRNSVTRKKNKSSSSSRSRVTRAQVAQKKDDGEEVESDFEQKEWWQEYVNKEDLDNLNHSAKIFLLFEILKECEEIGDKILVFSQSLYTLNCIEYFLEIIDKATQAGETEKIGGHSGSWALGLDYFRLDGSSSCDNRAAWCDAFNNPDNTRARLFLISTKAGGLGINLVAANRVIIFDVSWNPSHDIQSIYRVYRFGQTKPSYIYRFVSYGTMEMKIYERQVTKQAISKRVIDEQQIDRHYSQNDIQELYKTDLDPVERPTPLVPKDVLLGEMLQKYEQTIFKYHEHQSLLENKQDEELDEEERKAAWEEFENEKKLRRTALNTGNIAALNMPGASGQVDFSPHLIQLALANIVRKDNPTWSEIQIRGILPALVQQLQMQVSENNLTMFNRVQQEIRLIKTLQEQRMREQYIQDLRLRQMLKKQQMANQMIGHVSPEELRILQGFAMNPLAGNFPGSSEEIIDLND